MLLSCVIVSYMSIKVPFNRTHPKEDVLGGIESCGVDAGSIRRCALAHDAAGKSGDGALD